MKTVIILLLMIPFVVTANNLRRKLRTAAAAADVDVSNIELVSKIVGVDMLLQDLKERPRDRFDDVRIDWITNMVRKVEHEVDDLSIYDKDKDKMVDSIIDLKNELMRAKETILINLESESTKNDEEPSLSIQMETAEFKKIYGKAQWLKDGITDLTNELMLYENHVTNTEKEEEEEIKELEKAVEKKSVLISLMQEVEALTDLSNEIMMAKEKVDLTSEIEPAHFEVAESGDTNDATVKPANIIASLKEFGATEAEIAEHYGITENEVTEEVDSFYTN